MGRWGEEEEEVEEDASQTTSPSRTCRGFNGHFIR